MSPRDAQPAVLVTGASGGVGSAIVRRLDALGWQVFAGARSLPALEPLLKETSAVPVTLDVTDPDGLTRARAEVEERLGGRGLRGLVNNAGISVDGPLELVPAADLQRVFAVNVTGAVAVTQAFLPLLRQNRGRVVNIGGAAGRVTLPMYGALSATKAALDSVSAALRMELAHQGVSVSYIEPGALDTQFFLRSAHDRQDQGYAGDADVQRIYATALARSGEAFAASSSTPVTAAAAAVERALTARRPSARYVVGRDARLITAILPRVRTRTRDRLVMRNLGLDAKAFEGGGVEA